MPASLRDRITPTAVGIVSRAWVIGEVERHAALARALAVRALRWRSARWIDESARQTS